MRLVPILLLLVASPASARRPLVRVAVVQGACFDARALGDRIRDELLGAATVTTEAPSGAHLSVTVRGAGAAIELRLENFDETGRPRTAENRHLPADDCAEQLETAAIVVARAALPLRFRLPPPKHRVVTSAQPPKADERAVAVTPEVRPEPQPAVDDRPSPPLPPPVIHLPSVDASAKQSAPPSVKHSRRRPLPRLHPVELTLSARWIFPVDDAPSAIAGELSLGYGWTWMGIEVRGGVAAQSLAATAQRPDVKVATRRIPIAIDVWFHVPVRVGAFRLAVGPELSVWRVASQGLGDARDSWVAQPGVVLRAAYRYAIERWELSLGVVARAGFTHENLFISDLGVVGHLPMVDLAPELSVSVRL